MDLEQGPTRHFSPKIRVFRPFPRFGALGTFRDMEEVDE
jgi:hypothetical protein